MLRESETIQKIIGMMTIALSNASRIQKMGAVALFTQISYQEMKKKLKWLRTPNRAI